MKQTLKKLSVFMMAMAFVTLSGVEASAQAPQKFNYQGIARDAKGNPMAQQKMSLKISVLPTSDATAPEYEEIQTVNTNEFGLYTLQIGAGTAVTGEMKTVKWETGNKYIKVAIDAKGGTDFVDAGTSQLLSVPYAIYADKAGMAKTSGGGDRTGSVSSAAGHVAGDANYLSKFTGLNVIAKSQLYDNGTNIGIGTTSPASRLHLYSNVNGVQQHIRMQNVSTTGAGRFTMYNDGVLSYATFSKYGNAYPGGYLGIPTLYPFANLLAFGNNGFAANDGTGRFLISTAGNTGISIFKDGSSRLKFHADFASENVGIGGNSEPVSRVHLNNTDGTILDLRLTNNTTGHTATDGMTIAMTGNNASVTNRENGTLSFGTSNVQRAIITSDGNVGIGTSTPTAKLQINAVNDSALVSISTISEDSATGNYFGTGSVGGISPLTYGMTGEVLSGDYGAGVFGRGYGSTPLPFTNRDLGLYGSANFSNTAIGILGSSNNGTAVMGLATTGIAGLFKAPSGTAILADSGNVIVNTGKLGIGTTAPNNQVEVKSNGTLFSGSMFHLNDSVGNVIYPAAVQQTDVADGIGLLINKTGFNEAVNVTKNQTGSFVETMVIRGNMLSGTPTLRVTADTNLVAAQLQGKLNLIDGTQGDGKILVSDAGGQASWSSNAPGTIGFMGSNSSSSNTPTATTSFISGSRVAVTITSTTQTVHITTTVALGAGATAANALNLYVGYNNTNATTPVTTIGAGSFGLTCPASNRNHYTLSTTITGLAPGTYYFGMVGSSSSANWTNNEFGYTSVFVKN